jgi:hypothetical protein
MSRRGRASVATCCNSTPGTRNWRPRLIQKSSRRSSDRVRGFDGTTMVEFVGMQGRSARSVGDEGGW